MSFDQKSSASVNGSSPSPALTGVTAGRTLALMMSGFGPITDTIPTDSSGDVWLRAKFDNTNGAKTAVYYRINASAGTHTLTWAVGSGSTYIDYTMVQFPLVTALDATPTVVTAGGANPTSCTGSITTSAASTILLGALSLETSTGLANSAITDPPTGWTSLFVQNDTISYEGAEHCYREVASAATYTAGWNFTADTTGQFANGLIVAFAVSGGGPTLKLFSPSSLNGLGSGGAFFHNRLG